MRLLYYQHPLILIVQIHHIYLSNQNNKVLYIVACDIWNWGLWEIVQNPPYFRGFLVALPRNVVVVQSLSCVQFLQPHGLQHIRLPCPSLPPPICWDSYPWSWWCYLTFSSSVTPFSSCPQSFPASRSFPMSWLRIRWPKYWRFSFSISPSNEYSGLISFRIDRFDLPEVQGTLKSILSQLKSINISVLSLSWWLRW